MIQCTTFTLLNDTVVSKIHDSIALAPAAGACAQLWYKKPPTGNHAYHRFLYIGSRWRIDPLDIEGSMGTVPRQESMPNGSMRHRELF